MSLKSEETPSRPRVLFLVPHSETPSSRIRVINLLPELTNSGLDVAFRVYPKGFGEKWRLLRG